MNKKKIIIIGPAYPLRGGIADSNHSLALALQKQGHEVQLLSFSLQYPSMLFPGKTQFDLNAEAPSINIRTAINSINPISWVKNALWLKRQRPDIVITRYWIPFIGASLGTLLQCSGLKKKIPLIALCDNVIPHENRPGDALLTRFFLNANNKYLVMSKSVGKDIELFVKKPDLLFHPHPVYDQFGNLVAKSEAIDKLGLDNAKKYILFFGFIRKYKGLDLLLDAMPNISEDTHLIVAGEFYEDQAVYEQTIQSLGISDRVHLFSDFIPQEEVCLYFSAADMIVQPYRTATQSGVAQIAYHFNKPILVTDVGGLAEIVPHKKVGYVVDVDALQIADAVNDFYEQDREQSFIANVKIEKKKYSWSNMAREIIEFIA